MPRRGLARVVVARALDQRRHAHRASVPRAAQESRAGNRVAARSTDRHREIHSSWSTPGGSGACAGGLPMAHLIAVDAARSGPGLNAVDQRRVTLAFISQKHGQFTYFSM